MAYTFTQGLLKRAALRVGGIVILPLLWCLGICAPAFAAPALNQYVEDVWSSHDGLPEGAALSLFEDSQGWLWVGTECCLLRFDGEHFYPLNETLAKLGQFSFARRIVTDGGMGFWVGFVGGVVHYDGQNFQAFGAQQGLAHPFVYALAGGLNPWVGTGGDGIWRLTAGQFERDLGFSEELSGNINDLAVGPDGVLWAATDKGVVYRTSDGVWRPLLLPHSAFNGVVNRLAIAADGTLWLAGLQGLASYSVGQVFRLIPELLNQPIYALTLDSQGLVWAGGEDAIYRFEHDRVQTLPYAVKGKVNALLEDSDRNMWVATGTGILRLKQSRFTTVGQPEGLPQNDIKAILADTQNGVWLIDGQGAVNRFKQGVATQVAPAGSVLGSGMLGLAQGPDGALWLANDTLSRIADGLITVYKLPDAGATLVEPTAEGFWVAQTQPNGASALARLITAGLSPEGGDVTPANFMPLKLDVPMRHIQRIYTDRQNHLWLATGGSGLLHLDNHGQFIKQWTQQEGLPSNIVYGMTQDADGGLWVATRSGMAWLHDGRVDSFAQTLGAPVHSPVHVYLDASDRFWITADDGVHLIPRAEFIAAAQTAGKTLYGRVFDTRDGLRSLVVSWRRGGQAVTPEGTLYYATTAGVSHIKPALAISTMAMAPVTFEAVRIGDQPFKGTRLTIDNRQQHISIGFTVPDLSDAQKIEFRTRLVQNGHHSHAPWSPATTNRSVQFSNLAQGHYTFEVAARLKGQAWNPLTAALVINVPPRFYERSVFQLAIIGLAILLTFFWGRARLLRARRTELILRRRVADRTAELSHEVEVRKAAQASATDLARHLEERVRERTAQLELAEMAVRRSEGRFALAAKGAEDGIWDWDIALNTLYLSPRWQAILGYSDQQFPSTLHAWLGAVHPDDESYLRDLWVFSSSDDYFRYEYRMRHKEGHYVWVLTRGVVIRDTDGAPTRAAGSQTDISPRKTAEAELAKSQTQDVVTGLPNRFLFADRLNQSLLRGRQLQSLVAVIYLDIDQFRGVNETYGHAAGDDVLRQYAQRIIKTLRTTDSVARVGNDEFAILITEVANTEEANFAAERLRKVLAEPLMIEGKAVPLTCSMGLKLGYPGEASLENFLVDSELAVVQAKSAGGARMSLFDNKLGEEARERKHLEAELKRGLEASEFVLHYQPLICSASGAVVGVEALARWQHPTRGLLGPYHFIGMLEACGLIVQFSDWVLRAACAQAAAWQQTLAAPVRISINVPAHQLNDETLYNDIHLALEQAQIPASLLGIEIVETSVLETRPDIIENLRRLQADGVQISIDDFGTGYSAFSYLNNLPIDRIKIDRSFCQRIPDDPKANSIFAALLDMIRQLGMEPVAEGVETLAQFNFIHEKGAPIIQGYFFSKPLDAAACKAYLASKKDNNTFNK